MDQIGDRLLTSLQMNRIQGVNDDGT